MQQWEVYYYKKANFFYLLIIPFFAAVFAPMFSIMLKPAFFAKYEPYFEMALIVGLVIFLLGFIAIWRIKTKKHKSMLTLQNGAIDFLKKEISLSGSQVAFGRYGMPATGSLGTVLCIKNKAQKLSIGIIQHTLNNANSYTEPWSMKVDCFLEKRDLEPLLHVVSSKAQSTQPVAPDFKVGEAVFELRSVVKAGVTLLLFYAFIALPITLMLVFSITNPIVITLMILAAFGAFIRFLMKQNARGKGYFLVFSNGLVKILHLQTRREMFSASQTSVSTQVYLKTMYGRTGAYTWLTLQLNLPGFNKITIGQPGPLGRNNWKKSGLREKSFTFSAPHFMVDKPTWNRLAATVGVVPPVEG